VIATVAVAILAAVLRIGMLDATPAAQNSANVAAFRAGLRELGYAEGEHYVLEYRSPDGRAERLPDLARELVRMKTDVIVARGTQAVLAARKATTTIPIVVTAMGDPVGMGVVATLARPGGNVTGLSAVVGEIDGKRLALLVEAVPKLSRVARLADVGNPAARLGWSRAQAAARSLGVELQQLDVRTPEDLGAAFERAKKDRVDAILVGLSTLTQTHFRKIVELAAGHRLPSIYPSREFVEAGGLIAYGVHYPDLYRRAAIYVDKIVKGAHPGDLPVEQPTRFELLVNAKAAKALGVTIPPSILLRADEVIQ
jgi:putative ABC transport system substrate-binding protein